MHDVGAAAIRRHREVAHPEGVDRERAFRVAFAAVDVGHRRGVDHRVGRELGDHLLDLLAIGEIEFVTRGAEHLVVRAEGLHDAGADLAGRAGDEDAHGGEVYGRVPAVNRPTAGSAADGFGRCFRRGGGRLGR